MTRPKATQFPADESQSQIEHFLETARALGCDEDEAAFDEKLKAVVGPNPKKNTNKPAEAE